MKMHNFRGDLINASAKRKVVVASGFVSVLQTHRLHNYEILAFQFKLGVMPFLDPVQLSHGDSTLVLLL